MSEALIKPAAKLSPQERQIVDLMVLHNLNAFKVAEKLSMDVQVLSTVLARAEVRKEIGLMLLTERKDRLEDVKTGLILSLWNLVGYDPAGAFNELGQPKNIHDIPPELRMAIKGMKQTKFGMEFTFYDRSTIMLALLGYFERDNKKRAEETEEKTIIEYYQDEEYD